MPCASTPHFNQETLVFLQVFACINRNRSDDDQTLDDVLPVWADAGKIQTVADDLEHQHADDHTTNFTNAPRKRHTAHHAGRNRIQLIHVTRVVGGRTNTSSLQRARQTIQHTSQSVHTDQGFLNVHTLYNCRCWVSTNRKHVFTKTCFVPQHPHEHRGDCSVNHKIR